MTESTLDTPIETPKRRVTLRTWMFDLLLIYALLAGAYLRWVGIDWGDNQFLHPDERFLVWVGTDISPVHSLSEYFDSANSSLNPVNRGHGFYVYGTLPMFLTRYVVEWIYGHSSFETMTQVGRPLSALADLLTILFVYLVAERLYDRRVGILAAAFSAAAVLQIQQSHFFTMDTFITFFTLLAFYFAVRVLTEKREWQAGQRSWLKHPDFWLSIGFGLALGMAAASKINAAPMAIALPLAFGVRLLQSPAEERRGRTWQFLGYLILGAAVSLIIFRLLQPYAFSGPGFFGLKLDPRWLANMRELSNQNTRDVDFPPAMQWARRPIWFSWQNLTTWGLGLPLGLLAWIGFLWVGWRMLKGEWQRHILIWGWTALYFGWQSLALNPTMRYQLPIYPMLEIFAAWAVFRLWDNGGLQAAGSRLISRSFFKRAAAVIIGAGVLVATYAWAYAFVQIYARPITRIDATHWIFQNIPGPVNLHIKTDQGIYNQLIPVPYDFNIAPGAPYLVGFKPNQAGSLAEIYLPHIRDLNNSRTPRTLTVSVSAKPDGSQALAVASQAKDLGASPDPRGPEMTFSLDPPVMLDPNGTYYLRVELQGKTTGGLTAGDIALHLQGSDGNPVDQLLPEGHYGIPANLPYLAAFRAENSGLLTDISVSQVTDPDLVGTPKNLMITLTSQGDDSPLATGTVGAGAGDLGQPGDQVYHLILNPPVVLNKDGQYTLSLKTVSENGAIAFSAAAIGNEGEWDDGLPLRMENYDPFGGVYPLDINFNMYWDDTPDKLARFERIMGSADYIVITSNRQWGSLPRLPERFPMTTLYYRNLLGCPAEQTIQWCYSVAKPGMFQGQLGFELVQIFQSNPSLGSLQINDQFAEEAFTVYDHPKVLIFKKDTDYDPKKVASILGTVDFSQVVRIAPLKAGSQPANMLLPADRLAEQQNGGTWAELFSPTAVQNRSQGIAVLLWYLSVFLLGLIAFPLLRLALPGLADGGYPLARTAGMLLLSYLVWLAGSFKLPFERWSISLALGLLLLVGGLIAYRQRAELARMWREGRRYFLLVEVIALGFFLFDLIIRYYNPDLWHPWKGGEKPMDFAYFNAVLKSTTFPPYDPWYAGGYLNYYYFGFVFVGALVKWLGITPAVAYNLILPTIFSLIGLGAFSLVYNLSIKLSNNQEPADKPEEEILQDPPDTARRKSRVSLYHTRSILIGLAAALLMAVFGNLGTVRMIYQGYEKLGAPGGNIEQGSLVTRAIWASKGLGEIIKGAQLPYGLGDWYWNPSRAIPGGGDVEPITEFPFFTVLYADPHAHLFAMPIALLALGFFLSVVLSRGRWRGLLGLIASLGIGALAIGALRPTNTWDFYTYLALGVVALAYAIGLYYEDPPLLKRLPSFVSELPANSRRFLAVVISILLLVALSFLLYQPYAQWYIQGYSKIDLWQGSRTPVDAYLTHWGLFLFLIVSWMAWETRQWMAQTPVSALRRLEPYKAWIQAALALLVLLVGGLLLDKVSIAWLALPLAAWALVLILRPGQPDAKRLVLFLVGTGLVLTLMVEVVVLVGDIGRMNTVFKFYLQVWALFSVSGAAALGWLLLDIRAWLPAWRRPWITALALLAASAALFPVMGGLAKAKDRMVTDAPHTLDGMLYMSMAHYADEWGDMDLSQDYRAIRWMQENVQGSPVIVEANLRNLYRWGSRFSIYTGLPGVVGWEWHEQQQRASIPGDWISSRIAEVDGFYQTMDLEKAATFLRKYNVRYIILGQQERGHYPGTGLDKFAAADGVLWHKVYQDGATTIYEVPQQ